MSSILLVTLKGLASIDLQPLSVTGFVLDLTSRFKQFVTLIATLGKLHSFFRGNLSMNKLLLNQKFFDRLG